MIEEFKKWMEDNTILLPRTIKQYARVIRAFLMEYPQARVEEMNEFLQRKNSGYFYRYAFKRFLKFLGREEEWPLITRVKRKPKHRYGVFVNKDKIQEMIKQIRDRSYYIVAKIQYLTGARACDVLKLKRDSIKIREDRITLHLITKGNKEHIVAIPYPEAEEIVDFLEDTNKEYPFLKGKHKDMTTWVTNNYRYYYEEVKIASETTGLKGFRTHDFRRNFASDVYMKTRDVYLVKGLLGHRNLRHTIEYLQRINEEEEAKKAIERFRR